MFRIFLPLGIIFFGVGIWKGMTLSEWSEVFPETPHVETLRILSYKNALSKELLEEIGHERQLTFHLLEVETEKEFAKVFSGENVFDIIMPYAFQVPGFAKEGRVLPLKDLEGYEEKVHPDFRYLPQMKDTSYALPVQWGLNGFLYNKKFFPVPPKSLKEIMKNKGYRSKAYIFAQPLEQQQLIARLYGDRVQGESPFFDFFTATKPEKKPESDDVIFEMESGKAAYFLARNRHWGYFLPSEGVTFWTHVFSVSKNSPRKAEALKFIRSWYEPEKIKKQIQKTQLGTAASIPFSERLPNMLKPEYIREVDLKKIRTVEAYKSSF